MIKADKASPILGLLTNCVSACGNVCAFVWVCGHTLSAFFMGRCGLAAGAVLVAVGGVVEV